MNPITIRLLAQQLVTQQFKDPQRVVAHMGAIQAQDYRMMRWAVALRTQRPSYKAFEDAYNSGKIIRLHLLRGTWQLIAAEDYGWMMELCAPKALKTIMGWMKTNKVEIDKHELNAVRKILVQTCEKEGSVTKQEFKEVLWKQGIEIDNQRLSYHIRLGELSGTLCSGNLTNREATYALTHHKIVTEKITSQEEMLYRITRKYFQSHSPATFEDFQWWSGLNKNECRKGLEMVRNEIYEEKYHNSTFYIHENCRQRRLRKDSVILLPPFDEYLVGYKSRNLVIEEKHIPRAYTNNGIFFPIVAVNGEIKGNWEPWGKSLVTKYFENDESEMDLEKMWRKFVSIMK